jgi:hypothetical protein
MNRRRSVGVPPASSPSVSLDEGQAARRPDSQPGQLCNVTGSLRMRVKWRPRLSMSLPRSFGFAIP